MTISPTIKIIKTNSSDEDFIRLVRLLDADLAQRDGDDHAFFAQFNKIDAIQHVIVLYVDGLAVACGAIKQYAPEIMEVKRMYVLPEYRGKGYASRVLTALEEWAAALHYHKCILETGEKQPEAIRLYKKNNYRVIPNYGQYADVKTSICFEKIVA